MSDIRVEAIGHTNVVISDLGVTVRPGQVTWITSDQANNSACLTVLVQSRQLWVSSGERCKTVQPPKNTVHSVTRSRPLNAGTPRPQAPAQANMPVISKMLQDAAIEAARKTVAESRRYVQPVPQIQKSITMTPEDLESLIEKAVTNAIVKQLELQNSGGGDESGEPVTVTPSAPPPPRRAVGGEEPVYIPSNIVDEQDETVVTVKSSTSSSDALDDTAKALKNVKRAPRARKKDTDGEV